MKRFIYKELLKWKTSKDRKPLLLQGARQVGKTYLINEFGTKEYANFIQLNFEQESDLVSLFEGSLHPDNIIQNISLYLNKPIEAKDTLIFFDEVQISPQAIFSLKYFHELKPEFHIIAAGSLLGVSVGRQTAFPVGKVNFLTLFPMDFGEFLIANNEKLLYESMIDTQNAKQFPDIIHNKLNEYFKKFLYTGGMPEVVQKYIETNDMVQVRNIQKDILKSYERDFSKYAGKKESVKISEIWKSIPNQIARENKKFKFSDVRKKSRASMYEQTIQWLKNAGLIIVVDNLKTPKLPLSGYADISKFKIYLFDTGLLGAMLNLSTKLILFPDKLFSEYNGAFIENYVAQELKSIGFEEFYYWTSRGQAEVDFIINFDDRIIPIEVKSGTNLKMKSLKSYADKYHPELLVRLSPRNYIKSDKFINIPLYSLFIINEILKRELR